MMKRIWLVVMLIIVSMTTIWAQAEVNKQINAIKRSGNYFYEESTMNDEVEAKDIATRMLSVCVNKYLTDNGIKSEKEVEVADLVNVQFLKMKRGAMVCVFAYVAKSDFVPGLKEKNEAEVDVHDLETTKQMKDTIVAEIKKDENTELVSKVKEERESEVVEVKAESENNELIEVKEEKAIEEVTPVEQVSPVEENVLNKEINAANLKSFELDAIKNLLQTSNLVEAVALLRRLEARRVVRRMGTYTDCRDAAKSFWLICDTDDSRSLLTVLGPGADSRLNFKTNQLDTLIKYSGKNAVWFEFMR